MIFIGPCAIDYGGSFGRRMTAKGFTGNAIHYSMGGEGIGIDGC